MPVTKSDVERLKEIKDTMLELLDEALGIVKHSGDKFQYNRAKAYWHPHIQMALTDDHWYLGKDGATLDDAISALEGDAEDDDETEGPYIAVEYDLSYSGGDYTGVGEKKFVPRKLVNECGMNEAFLQYTGIDPVHIVHYGSEDVDEYGNNWEE